jgi:hypothetical protein
MKVAAGLNGEERPIGRVKGISERIAGCMRWARDGKIELRNRTWVAPKSARMGGGGNRTQGRIFVV